jgi:hypothetical protein
MSTRQPVEEVARLVDVALRRNGVCARPRHFSLAEMRRGCSAMRRRLFEFVRRTIESRGLFLACMGHAGLSRVEIVSAQQTVASTPRTMAPLPSASHTAIVPPWIKDIARTGSAPTNATDNAQTAASAEHIAAVLRVFEWAVSLTPP